MNKNKLPIMVGIIVVIIILLATPLATACTSGTPSPSSKAEPIVIKAVQSEPLTSKYFMPFSLFWQEIEKKSNGRIVFDLVGGPDAIPVADQAAAVEAGTIDLVAIYANRAGGLVQPFQMITMRRVLMSTVRERGGFDWIQDLSHQAGLHFLGVAGDALNVGAYVWLNTKVEKPEDLKGLRMASFGSRKSWIEALGMVYMAVAPLDRYAAIERGVADGAVVNYEGSVSLNFHELCNYWVDHGVEATPQVMLMNLDKWNSIPEDLQDLIMDTEREWESNQFPEMSARTHKESKEFAVANGKVRPITFSAQDEQYMRDLNYKARWEQAYQAWPETAGECYTLWGEPLK